MVHHVTESTIQRPQYAAFATLTFGAAGAAAALLAFAHGAYFQPYFDGINPLLVIALVAAAGAIALRFLRARGWFEIYAQGRTLRGVALAALLATLLVVPTIAVDAGVGFPRGINVPAPWSLLFYPAIAYVVEILFHVLPLALLLAAFRPLFKTLSPDRLVWLCIAFTALLEPAFQVHTGLSQGSPPVLNAYVGVHVFAFNLLQLAVFRRYGFVSMVAFRLVYYLWWHIAWGYLRLQLLF